MAQSGKLSLHSISWKGQGLCHTRVSQQKLYYTPLCSASSLKNRAWISISNFKHEKTVSPQDSAPHSCCYFSWFASVFLLLNYTLCSVPNVHTCPCRTELPAALNTLHNWGDYVLLIMFYCNCSLQQMPLQTAVLQLQYADDQVFDTIPTF